MKCIICNRQSEGGYCQYHLDELARVAWLMLSTPCKHLPRGDDHCPKCYSEHIRAIAEYNSPLPKDI